MQLTGQKLRIRLRAARICWRDPLPPRAKNPAALLENPQWAIAWRQAPAVVITAAPLAIEGLLLEILAGAARERELRVSSREPRWLAAARDCLHDAGWNGTLGDLASEVGVHPVTLARGFRKAYGCSVGAYLRLVRVTRAARRMAETGDSLAEIALGAGFADQSHFSNVFRRSTGLSPSAFRAQVQSSRMRSSSPRNRASPLSGSSIGSTLR